MKNKKKMIKLKQGREEGKSFTGFKISLTSFA